MVEVRLGDTVFRDGLGYSEAELSVGETFKRRVRKGGSSGSLSSSRSSSTTPTPNVVQDLASGSESTFQQSELGQVIKQKKIEPTPIKDSSNILGKSLGGIDTPISRVSEEKRYEKPLINSIEPFDKEKHGHTVFETRVSAGATGGIVFQTGEYFKSKFRTWFNVRNPEDLSVKSGIFVKDNRKPFSDDIILTDPYGQGTIDVHAKKYTTPKKVYEESLLTSKYGVSVPEQFIIEDIRKEKQSKAQRRYEETFGLLQADVYSKKMDITKAETQLEIKKEEIFKDINKEFEIEITKELSKHKRHIGISQPIYESKAGIDISPIVDIGTTVGLSLTPVGQGFLMGRGGLKMFSSVTKPTTIEKVFTIYGGALDVALGSTAFVRIDKSREAFGIERLQKDLASKPWKMGEVRVEGEGKQSFSRVIATRETDVFKQTLEFSGKVEKLKHGQFILPKGQGSIITTGKINRYFRLDQPTKYLLGAEKLEIGSKGFSVPLSEKSFVAFGTSTSISTSRSSASITLKDSKIPLSLFKQRKVSKNLFKQFEKNIKVNEIVSKEPFGSIGFKVEDDLILSKSGKITDIQVYDKGVSIDFIAKDISLTKIIKPTTDKGWGFTGGGSGTGSGFSQVQTSAFIGGTGSVIKSSTITLPSSTSATSLFGMTSGIKSSQSKIEKDEMVLVSSLQPTKVLELSLPSVSSASIIKPTSKGRNKFRSVSILKTSRGLKDDTLILPTVSSSFDFKLDAKLKLKTIVSPISTISPSPISSGFSFNSSRFIPPFAFLLPSPSFGGKPKTSRIKATRKYSYTPSFDARVFKIKGTKPTKTKFTGFEIRPLIKKRKKEKNFRWFSNYKWKT